MRKTRSQTQAEAALLNAARSVNSNTTVTDNSSNSINSRTTSQAVNAHAQKRSAAPVDPIKFKECEEMVNLLRVVELQQILSFLNISFAARKSDLQRRILTLLRTHFDLLSHKIREVYTQSIAEQQAQQYGPTDPKRMFSHMQMPSVQQSTAALANAGPAVAVGAQQMSGNVGATGGVGNNMVQFMNPMQTHMPIHPDVRLKKLAFYDVLGTLIKPSSLVPRNTQRIQEVPFYFTLTPQQATEIASNRDIRNSSKIEHAIQVQLRFCLLETSCEQEDCFPPSVSVKVNNKLCQLPNVIPTNRPNVEPKRPPRPVNVTANVKLSPTVTNTITVQWCPDYTRGYCIAVYLVKKLTSSQLLHRMKTKGVKPADYTRGLIKEKLTEDADCEIATTMLKVSLNCPLGKMKMSIPCRASTCSHLQCFDASLYLQMNERKPTWNCPVCDKAAVYDNLVIDGYFQEVLASSLLKPDDTEIQLHKDGSWSTHSLRNEAQILDTPTKPIEKVEVISDDIELITTEDVKMVKSGATPAVPNDQPTSTTNSETVDLTLSDSDDDMPLAKRRPTIKQSSTSTAATSTVSTSSINGSSGGGGGQRSAYNMQQQRTDVASTTHHTTNPDYNKRALYGNALAFKDAAAMLIDISNIQEYQNVLESTVIVVVGLFMHLNRISIIELKYSRLPLLSPNFASSLFVISVLCILAKMRPLYPTALRKPQRLLIFIVELALILYATDFFLRQVWVPILRLLNFVCRFLGQYVIVANEAFLANNAPSLSSWIRNDAFYIARFLLAVIVFLFMIDTTGILEFVLSKFHTYDANGSFFPVREVHRSRIENEAFTYEAPMMESDMPMTSGAGLGQVGNTSFDVNDLPFVPQEDLLNLGHRVGARRRRQPMRKAKRAKIVLSEPENECTC